MNVELTAMLWGGISGAAVFALGLYWLWDMKPDNAETEWLRSEVKDLRSDLNAERDKRRLVTERVRALEHPPFEPKFGDWVSTTYRGNTVKAVYLSKMRDGQHRVIANIDNATSEFYADEVEPLDD
jgi:hypothetical protein